MITVRDKQLYIYTLTPTHTRLAEKTEQYEAMQETLHHNKELLSAMQGDNTKKTREGSSRLANLNQALMKVSKIDEFPTTHITLFVALHRRNRVWPNFPRRM